MNICLKEFGVVCAIGQSKQEVIDNLLKGNSGLAIDHDLPLEGAQFVGRVLIPTEDKIIEIATRNNQLAYLAYRQIEATLTPLIAKFGVKRIAVIIGTSTAGIYESELARKAKLKDGDFPAYYHYQIQEMAAPAEFIANLCGASGPVYGISTACSSSGKALASARALLSADLADVVIAGGVDSLAQLTVNGFESLASIAKNTCQPFAQDRDGINIGEAAALFVMCKEDKGIQLLGVGETSDAYHMSAPAPNGAGAFLAMQQALNEAGLVGKDIQYVNLHGTGTRKNDDMEAKAMNKACGSTVLCSTTKHLTGHTLGAAGAVEIGLCWLLMSQDNKQHATPANSSAGEVDKNLAAINLSAGQRVEKLNYCMSNSFAFGGNNFSAVLGKIDE